LKLEEEAKALAEQEANKNDKTAKGGKKEAPKKEEPKKDAKKEPVKVDNSKKNDPNVKKEEPKQPKRP